MDIERIKDLANKGFITTTFNNIEGLTEAELIDKGFITHVGVFDGEDSTEEEDLEPVVDEGNDDNDEPVVDNDDEPVVDEGGDDTTEDTPEEGVE
jgi:hypothetical protein